MNTPTPPAGYKLVKGEDIKGRVPEGALFWVPPADAWDNVAYTKISSKTLLEAFYAIPETKPEHSNKAAKVAKLSDIPDDAFIFAQMIGSQWVSIRPVQRDKALKPDRALRKDYWFAYTDASDVHPDYYTAPYDIKANDTKVHRDLHFKAAETLLTTSKSLSDEAESLVAGDRAQDYGDVTESFKRIAALWTAWKGVEFTPWDVAQMMILLKVSRAKTSRKRDTLVDIIGYAECAGRVSEAEKSF